MKILHLEAGRHLYGGARQAGYLINALAARGIDNLLVCRPDHVLADTVQTQVLPQKLGGDLDFSLQRRLIGLIREQQPDLVHVHSRRGADLFAGRAAQATDVPAVLTRRVESAEIGFWLRLKCRPYRAIAAISTAVRDQLLHAGIGADRITLIPSAVDTTSFVPNESARAKLIQRYSLPDDAVIVGAAAQLIRRKGIHRLLPLMAALAPELPALRLLVFGQGPMRARLERATKTDGLERQIQFCGYTDDWPALVGGLDIFVHPAEREGLGAVVLEAMSAGVPVIASAAGGIVDVIEDDIDGRLLDPSAPGLWAQALSELARDAGKREQLAHAARRTVETRFTIGQMTEAYLNLYRNLADNVDR